MRFIKLAVISVIVLFIIVTLISLLLPSNVLVSRAVNVHAPLGNARARAFSLDSWKDWMTDGSGAPALITGRERSINIAGTVVTEGVLTDSSFVTPWTS